MNRTRLTTTILLGFICVLPARAQTPSSMDRYITSNTIAGVRVDLDRVDLNALRDKAFEWKVMDPEIDRQALSGLPFARSMINGLVTAGAEDLWVLLDLSGITEGPTMILTVAEGDDRAAKAQRLATTLELFVPDNQFEMHVQDDHIVVCSASMWDVYQDTPGADSPRKLPADILADQQQIVTAFYAPSSDHQRAMLETMPEQLPPPFDGLNPRKTLGMINHAAVRFQMKPSVGMKAEIQTDSAGDAEQLKGAFTQLVGILAQMPEIDREAPGLRDVLKQIPVQVNSSQVSMEISEDNGQVGKIVDALAEPVRAARAAAKRTQSMNNMKQIMLALHNYYDVNRGFPLRATVDEEGNPLLSWRVHLLPYLEQAALYEQFHLDEPWNSEHNKALIEKCPQAFRSPGTPELGAGLTNYVVAVAENTFLSTPKPMEFKQIIDGTSNTFGILETDAEHAVIWTKPDDLKVDFKNPLVGLLLWGDQAFLASRIDGSVQTVSKSVDTQMLQNLFQYNDGKVVNQ